MGKAWKGLAAAVALALALPASHARAEVHELRVSTGFGIDFLPLIVMEHDHLIQKQARAAGLGDLKVTWRVVDGGNNINDAMLSGALDFASIGVPGFALMWSKTKGTPQEIKGVAAVCTMAAYLNTRNPKVKTLADFTPSDRIAVPGVKTSANAIILEMGAAKAFGPQNYAKLDTLTVSMPYPEAVQAMLAGGTGIDSNFASPPFAYMELADPHIHTVTTSEAILGGPATLIMTYATKRFHDANPKTYAVFLAALREAEHEINADKNRAAQIYTETAKVKVDEALVQKVVDDPHNIFTVTPQNTMRYVDFMHKVHLIQNMPSTWKDLFFPEIHNEPGS